MKSIKSIISFLSYAVKGIVGAIIFLAVLVLSLFIIGKVICIADPPMNVQEISNLPPFNTSDRLNPTPVFYSSLIRLETPDHRFYCSAFVISNKYAMTAAHCLYNSGQFMKTGKIDIFSSYLQNTHVVARPAALNLYDDIGLIVGNFQDFKKIPVMVVPTPIDFFKGPFMACGYPYGDQMMCSRFSLISNMFFLVQGSGFIYPGMSGGPVIDVSSGIVVGVNSRVTYDDVVIAPLTGFFGSIGIRLE